ncbi:ATP-dependent nuclease [Halomonas sp. PBN3]|uniref:ATP-dependent nuclease n=1 Tax=Halomonas sp. PBN3 TaxID=1397528 RepID=UPI0003B86627|nr:AAA family ATPase [Halomonas sp. PBN3]ERS87964.1 hypothetical protein Q671_08620 [Halomonas sp. PBN3]
MHHLTDIHIQNFRSCRDVSLALSDCTPVVGYNNAGKSNIMAAIEWLVAPRALGEGDFFDTAQPVVVEGVIEGLDDAMLDRLEPGHRKKMLPFIQDERMLLRRVQVEPGGGKAAAKLQVCKPGADGESEGGWQGPPTGIPQAIQALFPEPIFIGAMEDAAEDATKPKTGTTLGKLLAEFTTPLEEAHGAAIQAAFDAVSRQLASDGAERVAELQRFDQEATQAVADFFPGINLHLDIPVPEVKSLFKQGTVKVSEHGRGAIRDFTSLGHGAQRSIQMALIRYLAELKAQEDQQAQRRLLLIEEPELFLHPQAIEQVRLALESLSRVGYQVVFATHSPMMIDRTAIPHSRIVRKDAVTGETRVMLSVSEALQRRVENADTRLHTLFELRNASGWLFSDRVLLAEGPTERRLLPVLYQAVKGRTLAADRFAVMNLGGVGSLPHCLKVFDELGIDAYALADFDFAINQAVKHRLIDKQDVDLESCLSQIAAMADQDPDIELGGNRRPTNNGRKKAAQVYAEWARQEAAHPVTMALHEKLKAQRVWLWCRGDIEAVLGLPGDKNEQEWAEFTQRLEAEGLETCVKTPDSLRDFFHWLNPPLDP